MKVTILNFENGVVDIISIPDNLDELSVTVEELLEYRGYNLDKIQYMVTKELNLRIL